MNIQPLPNPHNQAHGIIEHIQQLGFPDSANIAEIHTLIQQLEEVSFGLKNKVYVTLITRLKTILRTIEDTLKKNGSVSVATYTKLNTTLILFKENLVISPQE